MPATHRNNCATMAHSSFQRRPTMRCLVVFLSMIAWTTDLSAQAQSKKIIFNSPDEALLKELQSATPQARVVQGTQQNILQEIVDADGFIGEITPEQVRAGKKLKWVQTMSAGVERVLHLSGGSALRDSDIILTNNQIVQGPEIGDH